MKSHLTTEFVAAFGLLPQRIQHVARKNYKLWKQNPSHPSLQFKRVGVRKPVWSVRVGVGWRALGLKIDDAVVWFWVGPHADYDAMLRGM